MINASAACSFSLILVTPSETLVYSPSGTPEAPRENQMAGKRSAILRRTGSEKSSARVARHHSPPIGNRLDRLGTPHNLTETKKKPVRSLPGS